MVSAEVLSGSPASAKRYGVSKPISLAGPTEADIQRSAGLEKVDLFISLILLLSFSGFFLILLRIHELMPLVDV